MARNASGTHSLPTGNPVVSGTAASSIVQNATMSDLSAEITDSLSRSGKGGMSAPLVITAGAVGAPSIAPTGDTDTGIYASAANEIAITTGGTQRFKASSAGVNITGAMAATGAISGTTGTFTGAVGAVGASLTGVLAMGANKITELADGTEATDAATYGQAVAISAISSTSSGVFTTASESYVDVTNVTATIATTGGPVLVSLQPDGNASDEPGFLTAVSVAAKFQILRDTTVVAIWGVPAATQHMPASFVDVPTAGSRVYKLQTKAIGTGSAQAYNIKLAVVKL